MTVLWGKIAPFLCERELKNGGKFPSMEGWPQAGVVIYSPPPRGGVSRSDGVGLLKNIVNFIDPIPAFAGMTKHAFAGMTKHAFAGMTKHAFAGMTKEERRDDKE